MEIRNSVIARVRRAAGTVVVLLGTAPLFAADPAPAVLLQESLLPPAIPYEGRLTVTHWSQSRTSVEDVEVRFVPPNRYQWTFFRPDGRVARVVVSDGDQEQMLLPGANRAIVGDPMRKNPKRLTQQTELQLLLQNYGLTLDGTDTIVNRPVWVLGLTPKQNGKPSQHIAVDKDSGVVLEVSRVRTPDGRAAHSRYTRFAVLTKEASDRIHFSVDRPTHVSHEYDPDFLSLDELHRAVGGQVSWPVELPDGFVFESADILSLKGGEVSHVRYTDGLSVISVFETTHAIQIPTAKSSGFGADGNQTVRWKSGNRHFMLIGDVSNGVLTDVSKPLR